MRELFKSGAPLNLSLYLLLLYQHPMALSCLLIIESKKSCPNTFDQVTLLNRTCAVGAFKHKVQEKFIGQFGTLIGRLILFTLTSPVPFPLQTMALPTFWLVLYVFQVFLYSSMSGCLLHAVLLKFVMRLNVWLPSLNRSKAKALPSLTPQEPNVFTAIVLVNLPLHTLSDFSPITRALTTLLPQVTTLRPMERWA